MARYAIEDTTLTAIGDAVREKTGELTKIVYNKNSDIFTVELPIAESITHNFPVSKVRTVVIRIKEESFVGVSYYLTNLNTNTQTRITFLKNNDSNFDWIKEATISLEDNEYALDINNMWKDGYTATVELIYYDINNELIKAPGEVKNTMIPREMAEKINKLNHLPDEMLNITGDCQYRFAIGGWDWFINLYGNKITTSDISNALNMFYHSEKIETIPFEINFDKSSTSHNLQDMFNGSSKLKEIPKINNAIPHNTGNIFRGCASIRYLPEDIEEWFDWSYMEKQTSAYTGNKAGMVASCYSLRKIPMGLVKQANPNIVYSASYFYNGFQNCYSLDELVGLPIPYTATWTSNTFSSSFSKCKRLKELTFALQDDSTPYKVNWKNQTIDLSDEVGYAGYSYGKPISEWPETYKRLAALPIINYNSGITADKMIYNEETYTALKNDPDAFYIANTTNSSTYADYGYSRYNHDSAVNTINSLPDTTSSGGTNTIKFRGAAGAKTDGGAINTLTEAEIAVATAKGWTVSLV